MSGAGLSCPPRRHLPARAVSAGWAWSGRGGRRRTAFAAGPALAWAACLDSRRDRELRGRGIGLRGRLVWMLGVLGWPFHSLPLLHLKLTLQFCCCLFFMTSVVRVRHTWELKTQFLEQVIHKVDSGVYLFIPPSNGSWVSRRASAPPPSPPGTADAGGNPRSWWTQVACGADSPRDAGNRTRDLPPHGLTT